LPRRFAPFHEHLVLYPAFKLATTPKSAASRPVIASEARRSIIEFRGFPFLAKALVRSDGLPRFARSDGKKGSP
jgi:hypothetical protein